MFVGLQRVFKAILAAAVLVAFVALPAAALFDVGSAQEIRFTIFPSVLTLLDPYVRACFAHSLLVALVVAMASRLIGVSLGRLLFGSRVIGKKLGRIAFLGPLVFPGAILALGLEGFSDWEAPLERLCRTINDALLSWGASEWRWAETRAWLIWGWVGTAQGVALVLLSMEWGRGRVDLAWEDSARASGMPLRVIWRRLSWPVIRPDVARAVGLVFALQVVEAGIPRVLGLQRSVGFQMVELSTRLDPFPGLAAWGLMSAACLAATAGVVRLRAGRSRRASARLGDLDVVADRHSLARSRLADAGALFVLVAWLLVAWLPMAGLIRQAVQGGSSAGSSLGEVGSVVSRLVGGLLDLRSIQLLLNTTIVGLAAALLVLVLDCFDLLGRIQLSRSRTTASLRGILFPRLLLGIAVLGIPRLLQLLASQPRFANSLGLIARSFEPTGAPLRLLIVAVCLDVTRTFGQATSRRGTGPIRSREREDVARLFGIDERRARRLARGGSLGSLVFRLVFVAIAAATSTAPAIVLGPTEEGRTLTTGIIAMVADSEASRARGVVLACWLCLGVLVAWIVGILAASRRSRGFFGPLTRWTHLDAGAEEL